MSVVVEANNISHTIEKPETDTESDGAIQVSQLNLADFAGSERAGQTGATGERFKEGATYQYVSFRIWIMIAINEIAQNSIGGNAKTAMICAKQISKLNCKLEKIKKETTEEMENRLHEKIVLINFWKNELNLKTKIVSGNNANIEDTSFGSKDQLKLNVESSINEDNNNDKFENLKKQIQGESFHIRRNVRLGRNVLAFKNKNEGEIKKLRRAMTDINMKECYMCKNQHTNTRNQYVQTISSIKIQFCGTSSGIVEVSKYWENTA
ncbi:kinesin-like protein KIF3A [Polistes fuscatus]|uniref:kinesin-like protein KIF3A n=1 Tax=Polistes fuscatus TaxID=30207 RepID=UPI001CA82338|nr:kinesin-like protein KIF3A [Polistes fuscatus]